LLWREHHETIHKYEKSPRTPTICEKNKNDVDMARVAKTLRRKK